MPKPPLIDLTDEELRARLREMHEKSHYAYSPVNLYDELARRTSARHARVSMVTSVISAIVATAAVVLSAIALILGARGALTP